MNRNRTKEWVLNLPKYTRTIEILLFHCSPSLENYRDKKTLVDRIQRIELALKLRKASKKYPIPTCNKPHTSSKSV